MNKLTRLMPLVLASLASIGLAMSACSKKSSNKFVADVVPAQVEGTWIATVTHSVTTSCGEDTSDEVFTMEITQDGDQITIVTDHGYTATGTISGTQVTFTYSFPDGTGTTTSTVTIDFAGLIDPAFLDSFTGSGSYSWSDPTGDSCSGTDNWAGARVIDVVPGDLSGAWELTLTAVSTTCTEDPQEPVVTVPVNVIQVGDDVTISVPGLVEVSAVIIDAGGDRQLSVHGDYSEDGWAVVADGLLDIAADDSLISGSVDYSYQELIGPEPEQCSGVVDWSMQRLGVVP